MLDIQQNLNLRQEQKLIMTPQLQQAIKLLQLSRLELNDMVTAELLENPVLEESVDIREKTDSEIKLQKDEEAIPAQKEENPVKEVQEEGKKSETDEIDWERYLESYNQIDHGQLFRHATDREELPSYETFLTKKPTLFDHLMWQLTLSSLSEKEREMGAVIIGNLHDDGYLKDADDLVFGVARDHQVDESVVLNVLTTIQQFDPVGVASRDLKETLRIQATYLQIENDLVYKIIDDHLLELEKKGLDHLSKKLKAQKKELLEAIKIITTLDPKPGSIYAEDNPQYITPDVYVFKVADKWTVVLNEDGLPRLKINNYYQKALKSKGQNDTKEYIQDKMRKARFLINSIHRRQKTIYQVTEKIVEMQKAFFERGITHLKPMVLRDIAEEVELHEATISRVTTNKYVHTPQGLFELKFFFNSGLSKEGGGDMASESVKYIIKQFIDSEDTASPLSDEQIVKKLAEKKIKAARRTVAKYRTQMGIPASSKRKKRF